MAKLDVHQTPRGYSSVLAVCVYITEFNSAKRQQAAITIIMSAIEDASKCSSVGSRPLIYIGGDFNGANPTRLMRGLSMHQIVSTPTHTKGRTLDLLLTNAPRCYTCAAPWCPLSDNFGSSSDHSTIFCFALQADYKAQLPRPETRLVRSGKVADTVNVLRNANWDHTAQLAPTDPQLAIDTLYGIITEAQDNCQPLKRLKLRNDQPWMTLSIKNMIAERQKLFRAGNRPAYAAMATKVNRAIHARKRLYYKRTYPANNTKWWSFVNNTRNDQQTFAADQLLADTLNTGFHNVWGGATQPDLSEYININAAPPRTPVFTPTNVRTSIEQLDGRAPGPDGLSPNLLKASRLELCSILATIFNIFIVAGFVTSQWRTANITPIAKVDHPVEWSDYRPISLTSNMCKVFERIIAKLIVEMTASTWITNKQHGFLPGRSTMSSSKSYLT